MGIRNLNKFLRKQCPEIFQEVNLSDYGFQKVAIDISLYLFKYKTIFHERWLESFVNLVSCLRRNEIHCIFVYDTHTNSPPEKSKEKEKRAQTREKNEARLFELESAVHAYHTSGDIQPILLEISKKKANKRLLRPNENVGVNIKVVEEELRKLKSSAICISEDDITNTQEMFDILNIPHILAPSEAETLCSWMCVHDQVDAVLSEDTDVLAYGTPKFLTKINTSNDTCVEIDFDKVLEGLELTKEQFTDFCILCGNDYNSNIPKVGPVNAYKLLKQYGSIEEIEKRSKYDTDILNYVRVRELFSVPKEIDISVGHCGEPNLEKLEKFIFRNNCRVNMEKVRKAFAPKQMIFLSDDEDEE